MLSRTSSGAPALPLVPMRWFVMLELLCVAGFVVLLALGHASLAAVVLLGPFQLLLWVVLLRNGMAVLLAFAALLPLAAAMLLPNSYDRLVFLPGTVVLLVALTGTRHLFDEQDEVPRLRVSEWLPLLVLGVWSVVSAANAIAHGWGWRFLLVMTLVTIQVMAMAYFFATVPRSLEEVRTILYVVVAAGTFVAVCAPLLPGSSRALGPTLGGKTVATPFGDANLNVIGYALGAPAAVALGLTVGTERAQTRFWFGAASVICALGLVLTKSRGAWLGFSAAFLYVMVRRRSLTLVVTASSVGLAVFLSDLLRALLISRASATTASDPSLLGRYLLWDYAWRIGRENWLLGVGMENFRYVKHLYGFPERLSETIKYNTHNIFLEVFVDLGVVGLAAFSWLLLSSFSKASRATDVPKARDLGLGLSAGLVAYVAHGLVDCVLFRQSVFALLGLLVGLSICTSRLVSSGRVSTVTT